MPYLKDKNGNWKWQDDQAGTPEDQAQRQYVNAGQDFIAAGPADYKWNGDVNYKELGGAPQVGQTGLKEVTTDPRLLDAQMKALAAMEEQGNTGLSAADELALNQSGKKQASDARSRQLTIEQDLARKGRSGGRLGIAMQQQANQAAQEAASNDAAQRNVMAQEGRLAAKTGAANLAGSISNEEYQRKANAAQAQDAIAKFNQQNTMQRQEYNNNTSNRATEQNWQGRQGIANQNAGAGYDHRQATMAVEQNTAAYGRDKAVDEYNRKAAEKAAKAKKRAGIGSAIGGIAGGAAGLYFGAGNPAAGAAGYQAGSSIGGSFAHGGRVYGPELVPGNDPANDVVPIWTSGGETVLDKEASKDPLKAAMFVANENAKESAKQFDPKMLDYMSSKSPEDADLVSRYKARMAKSDEGLKSAQQVQDMGSYANIAGDLFTNFANSQKDDVIYKNRTADMGRAPHIQEAERKKYDGSMVNELTSRGIERAKADRSQSESDFMTGERLTDLQRSRSDQDLVRGDQADARALSKRMKDPSSPESIAAQQSLMQIAPKFASGKDLSGFSATQIQSISPQAFQASQQMSSQAFSSEENRKNRESASADRTAARDNVTAIREITNETKVKDKEAKDAEKMEQLRVGDLGFAQTADDAKQLKTAVESKANFDGKLDELISLRTKHGGGAILNREDVGRANQLSKDLLLEYKNMAKLGVLSQSDEAILNKIIPSDPLEFNSPMAALQGQDPTLENMKKFKNDANKDYQTKLNNRLRREGRSEAVKSAPDAAPKVVHGSDLPD